MVVDEALSRSVGGNFNRSIVYKEGKSVYRVSVYSNKCKMLHLS